MNRVSTCKFFYSTPCRLICIIGPLHSSDSSASNSSGEDFAALSTISPNDFDIYLSGYPPCSNPSTNNHPDLNLSEDMMRDIIASIDKQEQTTIEPCYEVPLWPMESLRLRILAEPRSSYRERYESEINPEKNHAQRYIPAELGTSLYDYPTVQVILLASSNHSSIFVS